MAARRYLIDTNILSEIRKGARCDANVAAWFAAVTDDELCLSTLVLGEIRKGIELARPRDPAKASGLEAWLEQVARAFGDRLFGIDAKVADRWGCLAAIRPVPVIDGLLAATAIAHDLILVTRNSEDVAGLGAAVLNPFRAAGSSPA